MKLRSPLIGALLAVLSLAAAGQAPSPAAVSIVGAGASFPAPLYKQWIATYRKIEPGATIDYRSVGSGEGVKRFMGGSVDFGASDSALSDDQVASAPNGAVIVPATAGMVVLAYNLPGLNGPLKLSRHTYVALLMGKIPRWNDARIQASNPGLNLPNLEVQLVARQDSSGTTFALSNHLSAVSTDWRDRGPGTGKALQWPPQTMLQRGNEGVAARIQRTTGSIGYVEYGYAKHLKLPVAHLENSAGRYVAPDAASGSAALRDNLGRVPANLRVFIPDPEGADSYPIVTFSWLLLKERYADKGRRDALVRFVAWGLQDGQSQSSDLGYIPLPGAIAERSKEALLRVQ